ncbi:lysophospholipid acyltransferase family protein [Legionella quateirensis]|uniref:2-acyl-glycerophospho-ethanolamine acyltransferase n=1 Tax=Legionella quateirensis TaxID=45072 RepID=A0A378KU44_9GAMM|nr:lysophospholipid acyltransferase family protein [Legionella quateirensis]KTD54728.1 2-acyl-glycerophospho-ethanolamine acyltransferase [Legionella quateirensis]STY16908.1 2-acyl-glycerophospho-ethanolamine acyltransferase [Legionella quateirensis]
MNTVLRFIFYQIFIRPFIYVILGLNVTHRERLPLQGPAIIVANHNSHLDTMVLMSLFRWKVQKIIQPVAAADYFLKKPILSWFSQKIIGIIPISRNSGKNKTDPLFKVQEAINEQKIIIFYPEGSRGEPEKLSEIKKGIAHLLNANPDIPVYPIYIYGLGKSLPKDERLLVPFVIDVIVGEPFSGSRVEFSHMVDTVRSSFNELKLEIPEREWE